MVPVAVGAVRLESGVVSCHGATHQHLNAGARGSEAGAALYFVNGDRFAAASGYVVALETGRRPGRMPGCIGDRSP
jgi:hypothetical protein